MSAIMKSIRALQCRDLGRLTSRECGHGVCMSCRAGCWLWQESREGRIVSDNIMALDACAQTIRLIRLAKKLTEWTARGEKGA